MPGQAGLAREAGIFRFGSMQLMDQRSVQIPNSNDDANIELLALARLLGRQAAKELSKSEQADPVNPLNKDEGTRDD